MQHYNTIENPTTQQCLLGNSCWYAGAILWSTNDVFSLHLVYSILTINSPSIFSSAQPMNFLAQSLLFGVKEAQSNTYPGLPSVSRHLIGNVSMMISTQLYQVQIISNKSSLMNVNQPYGTQYLHLKNSRCHGRRSPSPTNTASSRMPLIWHLQRYASTTTSLTTSMSPTLPFVCFFWNILHSTNF